MKPDEFGIYRDRKGNARAIDGRLLHLPKEDVADAIIANDGSSLIFGQQHRRSTSIDAHSSASIDPVEQSRQPHIPLSIYLGGYMEHGNRAYRDGQRIFYYEKKDEFGIYRDETGRARDMDGNIVKLSKDDIRAVLERANTNGRSFIHLPEDVEYTVPSGQPSEKFYTRTDIDYMLQELYRVQESSQEDLYRRIDDVYYPIDRCLTDLTARMATLETNFEEAQKQHAATLKGSTSIDGKDSPAIDAKMDREDLTAYKLLEDRLDEITFSQDIMRDDITQQMEDQSQYTKARLNTLQRTISNLQGRMHSVEVAREIIKNEKTRADEALRSFIGTWFQQSKEEVDTCFPSVSPPPY